MALLNTKLLPYSLLDERYEINLFIKNCNSFVTLIDFWHEPVTELVEIKIIIV